LGDDGFHGEAALVEAFRQEHAAAQVLVVAVAVAGAAGDEEDLFLFVLRGGGGGRQAADESEDAEGDERAHGVSPFVRVAAGYRQRSALLHAYDCPKAVPREIKKAESGESDSASRREGCEPFTPSIARPCVTM